MTTTISNISEDILMEILSRLPVKFVTQCKCICKPWCTLVTTTRFIKFYLNRAKEKSPNLILASNFHRDLYSLDCETCEESVHLDVNLPRTIGVLIVGSCNDMVCLSDYKSYVSLWNPSTREYVQLSGDDLVQSPGNCGYGIREEASTVTMGFGCDPVAEEYKLVRIEYFFDVYLSGTMTEFDRCEVKIYTFGTNSWRLIHNTPSPPCYIGNLYRVAHVSGVLYWVGLRGIGFELSKSIISFDLRNEMFGEVAWPEFEDHSHRDLSLGVLQGCLCTFSYHLEHVDIWVMKDVVGKCWTRQFSITRTTKYLEPLVLRKDGAILLQMGHRSLLLYDPVNKSGRVLNVRGMPDRFRSSTCVEGLTRITSLLGNTDNSLQ